MDASSGYIEDASERRGTIPGNHQEMAKFSDPSNAGYKRIYNAIEDFVGQAQQAVLEKKLPKPNYLQS